MPFNLEPISFSVSILRTGSARPDCWRAANTYSRSLRQCERLCPASSGHLTKRPVGRPASQRWQTQGPAGQQIVAFPAYPAIWRRTNSAPAIIRPDERSPAGRPTATGEPAESTGGGDWSRIFLFYSLPFLEAERDAHAKAHADTMQDHVEGWPVGGLGHIEVAGQLLCGAMWRRMKKNGPHTRSVFVRRARQEVGG